MMDTGTEALVRAGIHLAIEILLKGTVVVAVAGFVTVLLRRRSAAVRSAVWSSCLAFLVVLPIVSLIMPWWQLEAINPMPLQSTTSHEAAVVAREFIVRTAPPHTLVSTPGSAPTPLQETTVSVSGRTARVLLAVWLVGALLMLCRLTLQLLRVSSLTRRARRLEDAEAIQIAAGVLERLGVTRPVRVLVSAETSVPFSWGIFNPVIVLPPSCASWPRRQKHSVMLHELAHVVRWDYPIHLLIEFVRAIYWPNPLVCVAAKKNALERERACDDFALQRGARSREYARHLIEIALSQLDRAPIGATTMADEPGLFERIRCVMSERVDHSPLGFKRLLAIVCLMLALVGPVASMRVVGHPPSVEVPSLDEVIERLQNSDEDPTRRMAAWWLGEMESERGVQALAGALRDPSAGVRLATAWALGEIKDAAAVGPLVEVLYEDEDPLVREMAALALGEIDAPDAVRPLVERLEHDNALAVAIVWALGEIRTDEAMTARAAAVATWPGNPSPNREIWVGRLENGERFSADVRHLVHELRFGDSEARRLAAWNLGFLGVLDGLDSIEPVVGPLLDALRDPAPEVRAIAVWALDEINPSRSRARLGTVGADVLHERRLNSLGYYFLVSLGDADRAIEIFKKNVELHSESSNCYDSLGEAYMWTGDVRRAIENYEKALELDPKNENAAAMLRELRSPSESHHAEARVDERSRS